RLARGLLRVVAAAALPVPKEGRGSPCTDASATSSRPVGPRRTARLRRFNHPPFSNVVALKQIGLEGYRQAIARVIRLAQTLQERLRCSPSFELVAAGPLSITCFRYCPGTPSGDHADSDRLNRRLLELVQRDGAVFLTG